MVNNLFAFEGKTPRIGAGKGKSLKSAPPYPNGINPKEGEVSKISKGNNKQNTVNIGLQCIEISNHYCRSITLP